MTEGENPALGAASTLAFDEIEAEMLKEAEERAAVPTVVDEVWTPDMPSESKINDRGSFEKFRTALK